MDTPRIKPCPCCGYAAEVKHEHLVENDVRGYYDFVECSGCYISTVKILSSKDSRKAVINRWNRRMATELSTDSFLKMNEEEILRYLDSMINEWRNRRGDKAGQSHQAQYYIDAFQSVRLSLFGAILSEKEETCETQQ
jgi:Lar family restriction alleviation protein